MLLKKALTLNIVAKSFYFDYLFRKVSLAQIIADDRQMRALKSMLKDEQEEKTDRLDVCFKEIKQLGGLSQSRPSNEKTTDEEASLEDTYDSLVFLRCYFSFIFEFG